MAISITQTNSTNTTENLPKKRNVYDNYDKLKSVVHYDTNNQVDFVLKGTNNPTGKSLETKKYQQVHVDVVQSPTGINFDRATLNARIYKNDNSKVSETGFIVWIGDQTDSVLNKTKSGDTLAQPIVLKGSFSKQILNLLENTTYNYRAYVTHEYGTNYSKVYQFTTTPFTSVFSIAGGPTSGPAPLTVNLTGINAGTGITSYAWNMTGGPVSFQYTVSSIDVVNPGSGYEAVSETVVLINNIVQPSIIANVGYFEGTDTFGISSIDVPAEIFGFTNSARTVTISSNSPVTENATGTASGNIQVIADYTTQAITHTYSNAGTFNPIVYAINGNQIVKQATRQIRATGGGGGIINYPAQWSNVLASSYGSNIVGAYDFRNLGNVGLGRDLVAFYKFDNLNDSSANGHTLTDAGAGGVQFGQGKMGNGATTDGTNYLSAPNFTISGPFSLSFWMKVDLNYGNYHIGVNQYPGLLVCPSNPSDGGVTFSDFTSWDVKSAPNLIQSNTWHHYCLVTTDTSTTLYLDGVNVASSNTNLCSMANPQRVFGIFGNEIDGTYNGNSKGSVDALGLWNRALTESEITTLYSAGSGTEDVGVVNAIVGPDLSIVGTTQIESISGDGSYDNVSLLLNMESSTGSTDFIDQSTNSLPVTAFGNTQIVSITGVGSPAAYFDGSGDYLNIADSSAFGFGTGNFTMEAWIYPTATQNDLTTIIDCRSGGGSNGVSIFIDSGSKNILFYNGSNNSGVVTNATIPLNAWTHVAVQRSGTEMSVYVNGIKDAVTLTNGNDVTSSRPCFIGTACDSPGNSRNFTGYMDDIRITKGVARYTTNFIPPSGPLPTTDDPDYSDVSLLLNMGSVGTTFTDESNNNFTVTRFGTPAITSNAPEFSRSNYAVFDGNGDYLQTIISDWNPGVGGEPFTVEFWVYRKSTDIQMFVSKNGGADAWNSTDGFDLSFYANSNTLYFEFWNGSGSVGITNNVSIPAGKWTHLAAVYNGSITSIFVDGIIQPNTSSSSYGVVSQANIFEIGGKIGYGGNAPLNGYIDDIRVTKGVARYVNNFTPPQTLPTSVGDIVGLKFIPGPSYGVTTETAATTFPHTLVLVAKADSVNVPETALMSAQSNKWSVNPNQVYLLFSRSFQGLMANNGLDNQTIGYSPDGTEWYYFAASFLNNNTCRYYIKSPTINQHGTVSSTTSQNFNGYYVFGRVDSREIDNNIFGSVRTGISINQAFPTQTDMENLYNDIISGPVTDLGF